MKKIVVAIVALAMMVSAIAAMAQSEKAFSITPRLAYNWVTNSDSRDAMGHQFGVLADVDIASLPVGFEVGYMYGSKTQDVVDGLPWTDYKTKVQSIPVMVTYAYPFAEKFYAKVGAGVAFEKGKVTYKDAILKEYDETENKTNFAYKLGLGWNFLPNWSAEVFFNDFGKISSYKTQGIQLNVGYTF